MNAKQIEGKFALLGARFKVSVVPAQRVSNNYTVDIQRDRHGEFFEARYRQLLQHKSSAAQWGWQALRRNPRVYARDDHHSPCASTLSS